MFESTLTLSPKFRLLIHGFKYVSPNIPITCWISLVDTPTGYMSEDGGSPRPVDPNAMDVDSVNSPPAVSPQTGEWKNS